MIKEMRNRVGKALSLSGAILVLAIAAPAFAQYDHGYSGQGYY
jgi:hypothetical protein